MIRLKLLIHCFFFLIVNKPSFLIEKLIFCFKIQQEELRPFFSLPKVMDGLFSLAKMLFGIDIEPADGLAPVIYLNFF